MILLIDNYDSFVHNLARYFRRLGQETVVVRNDAIDARGARALRPGAIVLSPGPCSPREAGCSLEVVRALGGEIPLLGVCLGHQAIAAAFGGVVKRAPRPTHGRASWVRHDGRGVFRGAPQPLRAGRYHSLAVDEATLPACLEITARADDGVVMALAHRAWPVVGVQFHPESILTESGHVLLANFLEMAGLRSAAPPDFASELTAPPAAEAWRPVSPVPY